MAENSRKKPVSVPWVKGFSVCHSEPTDRKLTFLNRFIGFKSFLKKERWTCADSLVPSKLNICEMWTVNMDSGKLCWASLRLVYVSETRRAVRPAFLRRSADCRPSLPPVGPRLSFPGAPTRPFKNTCLFLKPVCLRPPCGTTVFISAWHSWVVQSCCWLELSCCLCCLRCWTLIRAAVGSTPHFQMEMHLITCWVFSPPGCVFIVGSLSSS